MGRTIRTYMMCVCMMGLGVASASPQRSATESKAGTQADKKADSGLTADQQGTSASDQEITQKIRKSVVDDDSLSTSAHNAKIITLDGRVTLRGNVESKAEKKAIEGMAKAVAGVTHVKNELTVTADESQAKPESK